MTKKYTKIISTLFLVLFISAFSSCNMIHISLDKELPLGDFIQEDVMAYDGGLYDKQIVDGNEITGTIDLDKEITTLTVLPGNKIHFNQSHYIYYERIAPNEYVSLPEPVLSEEYNVIDSDGTYQIYNGDRIMFHLDNSTSLQNGCYWDYTLTPTTLKIVKRAILDGSLVYTFTIK